MNKDSMPVIAADVVASVSTATDEDVALMQAQASAQLGADPSYFDPEVPFTEPAEEGVVGILPPELEPVPVPEPHPQAAELAENFKGLSSSEILAGLMPEISSLYRARETAESLLAHERAMVLALSEAADKLRNELATSNEEVNYAFRAGMEAEEQLAAVRCQKVILEADLQVVATQRDSYLSDLRVGSDMLVRALMRAAHNADAAAENEYLRHLRSMSLIELVREVVSQVTDSEYFGNRQAFFTRVAALRQDAAADSANSAKGESNEQDAGTA